MSGSGAARTVNNDVHKRLLLNVNDTFRALRLVRANGRRIGVNTRRKSMRDALVCWIIYVSR